MSPRPCTHAAEPRTRLLFLLPSLAGGGRVTPPGYGDALGARARQRIATRFDIRRVARRYEAVYDGLQGH
ncbi:MAG: glycosyltransferase [Burkholderiales bacterium]|jgi:hypothetical protein